ncbi:MFS transporter [Arthrobacter sp. zg-Y40]|uniref:MFS transporter n=1 Tax=unclassified Arthrobacter TaxID=235627 RepID=UPI001D13E8BC|nr:MULTISPECIES: MFS transporter [unclassified Arthrobacter]MCC3280419.1 MFS transporter [Arthrobacter sp. zg-Y40]MDK1328637.1 MFS transporter [Arthrobacter sp. zg-Y1143]
MDNRPPASGPGQAPAPGTAPGPAGPPGKSPQSLRAAWLALTGLSAVFLFEMLDNSVLNVALPTIGRDLGASTAALQWVTSSYSVVFGGLMIALSALADRAGRRKVMLAGLVLLAAASLATVAVTSVGQLIAVRAVMGVAAAMTTPGSMALAFRLFDDERLRVRALTLISTVGLVGLAIGPAAGGFLLAAAPWQALLLVNVPIAVVAVICIRAAIPADRADELHAQPLDLIGALTGTITIVSVLAVPALLVGDGAASGRPEAVAALAVLAGAGFAFRQRHAANPLLDFALVARPLVSSGLAFKAAAALAVAGLGYMVTLQLQLEWGWTPAQAALGLLPQVAVLIAGGALIGPLIKRIGLEHAARLSAAAVVAGLAVYTVFGQRSYPWTAVAMVLVAAGMRVVGVVSGNNVMRGLPADRTTVGAALVDTAGELATGVGITLAGTFIAAAFTGSIAAGEWTAAQAGQFREGTTLAACTLTALAALLVGFGIFRARAKNGGPENG